MYYNKESNTCCDTFLNKIQGEKYQKFLDYAFDNSDSISLTTNYFSRAFDLMQHERPVIFTGILNIQRKICDTVAFIDNFQVKNIIISDKIWLKLSSEVKEYLIAKKNILDFGAAGSFFYIEDLCFYRHEISWLESITHEHNIDILLEDYEKLKKLLLDK